MSAADNKSISPAEIPDLPNNSPGTSPEKPNINMADLMKNPDMVAQLQNQMISFVGVDSGYISSLPAEVKRRLKALKKIQYDIFNVEAEFYQRVREVEYEFQSKYEKYYEMRGNIISGEIEPTDSDCEWESDEEEDDEENSIKKIKDVSEEKVFGVPEFWLTTFKNIEFLNDMIQESDYPVMKDLIDVKCELHKLPKNGFDLIFTFKKNEYFKNKTLKKMYSLRIGPERSQGFSYEGPEIVSTEGCKIDWYPNKDLTQTMSTKTVKDKSSGCKRVINKLIPSDSFFNFFDPPTAEGLEKSSEEIESLLGADFEIGHFISERLVQRAVLYFTGDAISDEESEEDEDAEYEDGEGDSDDPDYVPENKDNCKPQ